MNSPVLLARELRWQTRLHLAQTLDLPIISVTLRAPNALRLLDEYGAAFEALCAGLERLFDAEGLALSHVLSTRDAEGPARHYAAEDALNAKRLCARFEEENAGGALLDADIMDEKGKPVSRQDIGMEQRACLVCGERPAAGCIAGRRHSLKETEQAFNSLIQALTEAQSWPQRAANHALRSLLYEVSVTPKPGLVDRWDSGAHGDMDYYSFVDSAAALAPYFLRCARLGQRSLCPPAEMLNLLRPLGMQAEADMKRATRGVNTHKGLIFSLGILCAASGRLGKGADTDALCALAADIAAPAMADAALGSHGDLAHGLYGARGARGEAAAGFPAARVALPLLKEALAQGEGIDRAGVKALLLLMTQVFDTNVLYRAGREGLAFMRSGARALLDENVPEDALRRFGDEMTTRGISPGGCADLLAIAFFLHLS